MTPLTLVQCIRHCGELIAGGIIEKLNEALCGTAAFGMAGSFPYLVLTRIPNAQAEAFHGKITIPARRP